MLGMGDVGNSLNKHAGDVTDNFLIIISINYNSKVMPIIALFFSSMLYIHVY